MFQGLLDNGLPRAGKWMLLIAIIRMFSHITMAVVLFIVRACLVQNLGCLCFQIVCSHPLCLPLICNYHALWSVACWSKGPGLTLTT